METFTIGLGNRWWVRALIATAAEDGTVVPHARGVAFAAEAIWNDAGTTHSGVITWPDRAKSGDRQNIWANREGEYVGEPVSPNHADGQAVSAGLSVWIGVAELSAGLVYLIRRRLDRWRYAEWDREINAYRDNSWRDQS